MINLCLCIQTMEGERQAYKQCEREAEILNKKNDEQEQKDRALQVKNELQLFLLHAFFYLFHL